jgi:hypothetical protein
VDGATPRLVVVCSHPVPIAQDRPVSNVSPGPAASLPYTAGRGWLSRSWALVHAWARAACTRTSPTPSSRTAAYHGANLDPLRWVKATYDPENVFLFHRSVQPTSSWRLERRRSGGLELAVRRDGDKDAVAARPQELGHLLVLPHTCDDLSLPSLKRTSPRPGVGRLLRTRSERLEAASIHARSGRRAGVSHPPPSLLLNAAHCRSGAIRCYSWTKATPAAARPAPTFVSSPDEQQQPFRGGFAEADYLSYLRHTNGKAGPSLLAAGAREGPKNVSAPGRSLPPTFGPPLPVLQAALSALVPC